MFSTSFPPVVIDRLYRAAGRLDAAWAGRPLAPDFGSRMIEAVLRHLDRHPKTLPPDDLARYAVLMLRQFWARNARRDAARYAAALERGSLPMELSLDAHLEAGGSEPAVHLYDSLTHDLCGGEWGRAIVQELVAGGIPPHWAWAFVWRSTGRDWEEVAWLMRERFGIHATGARMRQWGCRHYRQLRARIRSAFPWMGRPESLAPSSPRRPVTKTRAGRHRHCVAA